MKRFPFKNIQILQLLRKFVLICGVIFLICIGLSWTTLPFYTMHWLGTSLTESIRRSETIVLLGGSGMPSESNLIRSWFTVSAARAFPGSRVIIAMPGDLSDTLSTPVQMQRDLVTRGISASRISYENRGTNTRSQALQCAEMLDKAGPVLLVTSPEHMRRSILCFRKCGFQKVNGYPAFENASEADFTFRDDDLGDDSPLIPDVGNNMQVRYQMWTHLKYEILITREMIALVYYRLRGWI